MPADTVVTPRDVAVRAPSFRYLEWGPIFAGALGATAISFVLLAFGSALSLVFTAGLLASGAGGMLKAATDATTTVAAGVGAGATNHLSLDPADYGTDFLLRPAPVAVENATPANATAKGETLTAIVPL